MFVQKVSFYPIIYPDCVTTYKIFEIFRLYWFKRTFGAIQPIKALPVYILLLLTYAYSCLFRALHVPDILHIAKVSKPTNNSRFHFIWKPALVKNIKNWLRKVRKTIFITKKWKFNHSRFEFWVFSNACENRHRYFTWAYCTLKHL